MGWSAGPHLVVDDHQIWVLTPLTTPGVHSPSWNAVALGVEMLGDYDHDEFNSGRGALIKANAVLAIAALSAYLHLDPATMRLHREDPLTDHHCPGDNVDKAEFIALVREAMRVKPVVTSQPAPDWTQPPPHDQQPEFFKNMADAVENLLGGETPTSDPEPAPVETAAPAAPEPEPEAETPEPETAPDIDPREYDLAKARLPIFQEAADTYKWPPELEAAMQALLGPRWMTLVLMGLDSRESRFGLLLDENGLGDHGHGHGELQIDDRWHKDFCASGDWQDLGKTLDYIHRNIIIPDFNSLGDHFELEGENYAPLFKATLAAYNCGAGGVKKAMNAGADLDSLTTGHNYGSDVLARAQAFKEALS